MYIITHKLSLHKWLELALKCTSSNSTAPIVILEMLKGHRLLRKFDILLLYYYYIKSLWKLIRHFGWRHLAKTLTRMIDNKENIEGDISNLALNVVPAIGLAPTGTEASVGTGITSLLVPLSLTEIHQASIVVRAWTSKIYTYKTVGCNYSSMLIG